MTTNDLVKMYDGAFDPWKARLALSRIRALGFPHRDWPDLMQELAITIIQFKYDPEHAKGATEQTALYAAITRHLLALMRRRCRNRQAFALYLRRLGIREDGTYLGPDPCDLMRDDVGEEVDRVLPTLSKFDRAVAACLAAGMHKAAVARTLDCEWNTVHKAIGRIRQHFEDLDVDAGVLR